MSNSPSAPGMSAAPPPGRQSLVAESTQPQQRDANTASSTNAARIRRRNRTIASCLECRRRKLKCDKSAPCTNCHRNKRDCLYLASTLDSASQQRLAEIKDRMGSLEQVLERDVARKNSGDTGATAIKIEDDPEDDGSDLEFDDEKDLEPTPFAALDQAYEDDADDDLLDLGVQLGKLRVSERIGGYVRPNLVEELGQYGPRPPPAGESVPSAATPPGGDTSTQQVFSDETLTTFLGPGPDYIAPASSTFFPQSNARNPLKEYLPPRHVCDKLLEHYWQNCHAVVTIMHKPTFQNTYQVFWQCLLLGGELHASTQALLFAALFNAGVSISNEEAIAMTGLPRIALLEKLQTGTEACLSKASFLRTTKLETMQAFVLYLVPLCRAEISRAHSALTGTAIRLAECMGLHRDGTLFGFSPLETHVRRLIWYQLCFLDIRTCEATGPRPQIHAEDFDTKLPLNVNEADFLQEPPPTEDLPYFTDLTLSRMRFECMELHRQIWVDNPKIEQKKLKLSSVLTKVQKAKTELDAKYLPLFSGMDRRQMLALHIFRVLSSRCFIMILHRFFAGAKTPLPERLHKILMDACVASNEFAIALDTRPELARWAWYRGALIQFQSSMLLLFEAYSNPTSVDVPRIWKILDYVFEFPPHQTTGQKIDSVLFNLRDRLEVFQSMRKMRATKTAQEALNEIRGQIRFGAFNGMLAPVSPDAPDVLLSASKRGPAPSLPGTQDFMIMQPAAGQQHSQQQQQVGQVQYPQQQQFFSTPTMDASQFTPPPLGVSSSASLASGDLGQNELRAGMSGSPMDGQAMQMDDVDWTDWDKAFPMDASTSGFGMADLPDLDLGSFTPFRADDRAPGGQGKYHHAWRWH